MFAWITKPARPWLWRLAAGLGVVGLCGYLCINSNSADDSPPSKWPVIRTFVWDFDKTEGVACTFGIDASEHARPHNVRMLLYLEKLITDHWEVLEGIAYRLDGDNPVRLVREAPLETQQTGSTAGGSQQIWSVLNLKKSRYEIDFYLHRRRDGMSVESLTKAIIDRNAVNFQFSPETDESKDRMIAPLLIAAAVVGSDLKTHIHVVDSKGDPVSGVWLKVGLFGEEKSPGFSITEKGVADGSIREHGKSGDEHFAVVYSDNYHLVESTRVIKWKSQPDLDRGFVVQVLGPKGTASRTATRPLPVGAHHYSSVNQRTCCYPDTAYYTHQVEYYNPSTLHVLCAWPTQWVDAITAPVYWSPSPAPVVSVTPYYCPTGY